MQTTMVPEQVKTQKIQAKVQVSRPEDKDVIFTIGSALEDFILLYFVLVRNILADMRTGYGCILFLAVNIRSTPLGWAR
ncbi:hypothetical protein Tco_0816881 [Tanacetum coccineum]